MMSQRCNLFNAGFVVSLPTLYFSRLKLKDNIPALDDNQLQSLISNYFIQFEDQKEEHYSHVLTALQLAKQFDIVDFDAPIDVEEYFNWHQDLINEFEQKFPLGRIEHYYFLYARKIAELLNHMGLIKTYVDLHLLSKRNLNLNIKLENAIKDCEYLVFKLMAPAALLSSEPRQNCFNALYKQMGEYLQHFKNFDFENAGEEQLLNLKKEADEFTVMLMNGYKNCSEVLKDLAS